MGAEEGFRILEVGCWIYPEGVNWICRWGGQRYRSFHWAA